MDGLIQIETATNFQQFRAAAALVSAPSQNLVYADTTGNIGYQLMGSVPDRTRGNGLTPALGWDTAYDWKGLVPFAELPYVYNPPAGYIVAANQQVIGRQYPSTSARTTPTAGGARSSRTPSPGPARSARTPRRSCSTTTPSASPPIWCRCC